MKTLNIIKYVFTIIGALMLMGTFFLFKSTNDFLKTSITAQGTVINLLPTYSSSSSDNSITYKPLVEFTDKNGNPYEFASSTSSNPPSYNVGEAVEVLYNPQSPHDAKIKGFFSLWGGATILGILGLVFFLVGAAFFVSNKRKDNKLKDLKLNGKRIETDFKSVDINYSIAVNNRNPYQIISQWQNPATSKIHVFTSDNIWFDPTDHINTETIKVLIDKQNPKRYVMDISFLPEIA